MSSADDQMRGWKQIADYLQVSVRTAARWELARGLPLHRVSGGPKDAVFALRSELDAWMRSDKAPNGAEAEPGSCPEDDVQSTSTGQGAPPISFPTTLALRVSRAPRFAIVGTVAIVSLFLFGAFALTRPRGGADRSTTTWSRTSTTGVRGSGTRAGQPVGREPILLRLSRPDGWMARVGIVEGETGQVGGSAGRPTLILRPRRMAARLLVEIERADGQPVTTRSAPGPLTIVLEPGVIVDVINPFPFKVEWQRSARSE